MTQRVYTAAYRLRDRSGGHLMTPEMAQLDLHSIMAQYDDVKDEWDQAELWEHIPGLVSHLLIKRIRIAINLEGTL